jgi:hypothetical protein
MTSLSVCTNFLRKVGDKEFSLYYNIDTTFLSLEPVGKALYFPFRKQEESKTKVKKAKALNYPYLALYVHQLLEAGEVECWAGF